MSNNQALDILLEELEIEVNKQKTRLQEELITVITKYFKNREDPKQKQIDALKREVKRQNVNVKIDPSPVICVVKCSRTPVLVSNTQRIHTIWPICRSVVSPILLITLMSITILMEIIAPIPPLPHTLVVTCKIYYQLYLLSET